MNREQSQPEITRAAIKSLADRAINNSQPTAWFEQLYSLANDNENNIPWAKLKADPLLIDWLEKRQQKEIENKSALVIGCGLGDDAETIAEFGYQVTAFDISETAIAWCKKRFPDSKVNYLVADLLNLDPAWYNQFDFVFESITIQALPIDIRKNVIQAIVKLVADRGTLLVITGYRETEAKPEGPPWPLSELELSQFKQLGLVEGDRDRGLIKQLRIEYTK
ncbi:MAG: class I SAM-dependent methyltransferase [Prochloraceae cyanobacterium]|nr:class I SAM-dependent methyltransferase [Prochloraceae cyanobacterium]